MPTPTPSARPAPRGPLAARAAVVLALAGLASMPLGAQDWGGGAAPWSGLGGLAPPAGLANPMGPSTLSSWPGLAAPMSPSTLSPLSPWSGLATPLSPSTMAPWSGLATPPGPSTLPTLPYSYGSTYLNQLPGVSDLYAPRYQQPANAWQTPAYATRAFTCPEGAPADTFQPDLSGTWRGSGGETVEIERNRARIWGGRDKPCNCVFFLVGQRLIAYSPDTDMVRKYWYQGGGGQFTLIDEAGNLLTFQRAR